MPAANFPQMNFSQTQDRLRAELQRRIQRGTLSIRLLARQTGLAQSHLSNFLHNRRQLSLQAIDRILAALHISIGELLPAMAHRIPMPAPEETGMVPLVSHVTALSEPNIRSEAIQSMVYFPLPVLESLQKRTSNARYAWQRFVAVRILAADAVAMDPLVLPEAIALLDRHYTALVPYHVGRPNLYAVRRERHLKLRYVTLDSGRLVLRPLSTASPVELIDVDEQKIYGDLIVGRVAMMLNVL